MRRLILTFCCVLMSGREVYGQAATPVTAVPPRSEETRDHDQDMVAKAVDDLMWQLKMGDIAEVDIVHFTSTPPARESNPTAQGAGNPLIIPAHVYVPKKLDKRKKHAALVYVHGGVHSNNSTSALHYVREMVEQGYVVIAPEYRGSTGFGGSFYRQIDYGGRENDDVFAARNWLVETYDFIDPGRVGIVGWSHGGMIALMNIFAHPDAYAVAYAGVPVSDLVARMGYKSDSYRALFSAPYHIGKTADQNVQEYLKRSPISHVDELRTPLLIHTNTNDEDVNYLEVDRLANFLKAAGKQFAYKIYQDAPGGHVFNRLDTKLARESRAEIWAFLAKYLHPN